MGVVTAVAVNDSSSDDPDKNPEQQSLCGRVRVQEVWEGLV